MTLLRCDQCGWIVDESDADEFTLEDAQADFEEYVCADAFDSVGAAKCPECGNLQFSYAD